MSEEEAIKIIFNSYITQYEKCNTCRVGIVGDGESVIYKKLMITQNQIDFMKGYLEKRSDK